MRLIDIEVDEVSLVDKAANKRTFLIKKRAAEAEAKEKAEAEAKAKADAEAKAKAEAEAAAKADELDAEDIELAGKILKECNEIAGLLEQDSK